MSKSVQELEQDLAKAREEQAEKDREARAAEQRRKDKANRIDELEREAASVLSGIEHLKGKVADREKRYAEIIKQIHEFKASA